MSAKPVRKQGATCPYDFIWARRARHAFRLLVVLVFVFTFALWFSEGYLRYDRSETQYRMALTMHPAAARPILRTVVRREAEQNKVVSSRYLEALAQVEEPDKVLPNYKLAYEANPRNAFLIMNYGCALYHDGQYDEARERFREAGVNPPRNVLPRYLEAAALAAAMSPKDDMSDVIALLTRTNASEDPVLFPEPLWHESMPRQGQRYLEQRREIANRIAAPLNGLTTTLCQRAQESMKEGELQDWDNWLNAVAVMGERLMGNTPKDSPATIPQMTMALRIQYDAYKMRAAISAMDGGVVADGLNDRLLRLEEALRGLHDFDAHYYELLNAHGYRLFLPVELLLETVFAFLIFYCFGWFLHYLGSGGKSARAVPHIWLGKAAPVVGLGLMLAMLLTLMVAHNTMLQAEWESYVPAVWRVVIVLLLALGVVYPPMLAKRACMYDRLDVPCEGEESRPSGKGISRLRYLGIYGCLLRRYMGILCGGVLITICVWFLIYRMAYDVYPFQMQIITSSVGTETDILIEEIRQYLASP